MPPFKLNEFEKKKMMIFFCMIMDLKRILAYKHAQNVTYAYGLLIKSEVKMAEYWPSSFFACLWTKT